MAITIRQARPDDASFLAWVMLAATRSHLSYGLWEHYVGGSAQDCLAFLEKIAVTEMPHLFHHTTFVLAEENGSPVAGSSGYDPKALGMTAFGAASASSMRSAAPTSRPATETPESLGSCWSSIDGPRSDRSAAGRAFTSVPAHESTLAQAGKQPERVLPLDRQPLRVVEAAVGLEVLRRPAHPRLRLRGKRVIAAEEDV